MLLIHCLLDVGHWLGHLGDVASSVWLPGVITVVPIMRQIWGGEVYHSVLCGKSPSFYCFQVRTVNLVLYPTYTTGALNLKNG